MKTAQEYIDYLDSFGYVVDPDTEETETADNWNVLLVHKDNSKMTVDLGYVFDDDYTAEIEEQMCDMSETISFIPDYTRVTVDTVTVNGVFMVGSPELVSVELRWDNKYRELSQDDLLNLPLDMFEAIIKIAADPMGHQMKILQEHIKHVDWAKNVLWPLLKDWDFSFGMNAADFNEEYTNKSLTLYFEHISFDNIFWIATNNYTGGLISPVESVENLSAITDREELKKVLIEYWKTFEGKIEHHKADPTWCSYFYRENEDKDTYGRFWAEIQAEYGKWY